MFAFIGAVIALGAAIVGGVMAADAADEQIAAQREAAEEQKKYNEEQKQAAKEKARIEWLMDIYGGSDDPVLRAKARNKGVELNEALSDRAGKIQGIQSDARVESQAAASWLPVAQAAGNVVGSGAKWASTPSAPNPVTPTAAYSSYTPDKPVFSTTSVQSAVQSQPSVTTAQPQAFNPTPIGGYTAPQQLPMLGAAETNNYDPYADELRKQQRRFFV